MTFENELLNIRIDEDYQEPTKNKSKNLPIDGR